MPRAAPGARPVLGVLHGGSASSEGAPYGGRECPKLPENGDPFLQWDKSLWEHPLDAPLGVLRNGIETHLIMSHFAIPLMLERTGGLVIEVGDGTPALLVVTALAGVSERL